MSEDATRRTDTEMTGPVLVTGASGALGSVLMRDLPSYGWRARGFALPAIDGDWISGSITDPTSVLNAMDGVGAVVHLAGVSTPGQAWEDYLRTNIDGTYNVLEAARKRRVSKVVLASSNHAVGYTPRPDGEVPGDAPARPDSLYGVSKIAMESLGSFYADEHGLQTASVRVGSCFEAPTTARMLETWLSPADFVRLIDALLRAPWHGHRTLWGVSRNTRRWFSLTEAEELGFRPQDDAEEFASVVAGPSSTHVGGSAPPFG